MDLVSINSYCCFSAPGSFTIFGACFSAGMIFAIKSDVRIFRLDVLIHG